MHRTITALALFILMLGMASTVQAVKTTVFICHATNDPGHFNLLEVDDNALAGHRVGDEFHVNRKTGEQDYFASEGEIAQDACGPVAEATPTPTPDGDPGVTPTPVPSVDETPVPTPSETPVASPSPTVDPTLDPTIAPTPQPRLPNTGLPYMVDEGNHENTPNLLAFLMIAGSMGWMIWRAKRERE